MLMRFRFVALAVAALLGVGAGRPAYAVLGEEIAAAPRAKVTLGPYTLTERMTDAAVAVREYADASGVVFAVAWDGPARPDLHTLLGRYFEAFAAAVANRAAGTGRRDVNVSTGEMLVQMGAHLRSHRGRVVLRALVPEGASIAEIQ